MRPIDRIECRATLGRDVDEVDIARIIHDDRSARAAFFDGNLVGIYGCSARTLISVDGVPWFLGTHEMGRRPVRRAFVRHARSELEAVSAGRSVLRNACATMNEDAIRVLKWLGFTFPDHKRGDVNGVEFQVFEKER